MLGLDWSPLAATAHDFLAGIARREGFLPGPDSTRPCATSFPRSSAISTSSKPAITQHLCTVCWSPRSGIGQRGHSVAVRDREVRVADAAEIPPVPFVPLAAARFAEALPSLPVSEQWWDYVSSFPWSDAMRSGSRSRPWHYTSRSHRRYRRGTQRCCLPKSAICR